MLGQDLCLARIAPARVGVRRQEGRRKQPNNLQVPKDLRSHHLLSSVQFLSLSLSVSLGVFLLLINPLLAPALDHSSTELSFILENYTTDQRSIKFRLIGTTQQDDREGTLCTSLLPLRTALSSSISHTHTHTLPYISSLYHSKHLSFPFLTSCCCCYCRDPPRAALSPTMLMVEKQWILVQQKTFTKWYVSREIALHLMHSLHSSNYFMPTGSTTS